MGADKDKKTVLLVDDVRLFLKLEETFFKRAGCRVLTAESGTDAIKIAREYEPDVILLDYYMPDMKGDEVCEKIRQDTETKDIPIIIVSTSSKQEDIEQCYKAGCNDYITKPINPEVVLARTAQLLRIPYRLHRRLAVNFQVEGRKPPLTFTGFSRNLSESGILIETDQKLSVGDKLFLWLPILENQDSIELSGEVVRAESEPRRGKYLYGIKFIELDEQARSALKEYLEKHLPEQKQI